MNKVVLVGRPTRDPELKFTPGGGKSVATFTLAVDRKFTSKDGKKEADFIPCVVWGKPAETVANYSAKGKLLSVSGRIQTRSYDNKDGKKVYVTEVIVEDLEIIEWVKSGQAAQDGQASDNNYYDPDLTPVDEGDIPF